MVTDIFEFQKFHALLTANMPNYTPFYFPLEKGGKDPVKGISWKKNRLTFRQACEAMERGFNIGVAGTTEDPLVIIDIDDPEKIKDIKPSLCVRSRKRTGMHYFYFGNNGTKVNIPTEDAGEIRSDWQYVVVAGSFVDTDTSKTPMPPEQMPFAGRYTVENAVSPVEIAYNEFPLAFRQQKADAVALDVRKQEAAAFDPKEKSALYSLSVERIAGIHNATERFGSLWHGSDTGANTSVKNGLIHCWRHNVSHNALTALAVMAGLADCVSAGFGHANSGAGTSCLNFKDGETIFKLWEFAKKERLIPEDDKIPFRAREWLDGQKKTETTKESCFGAQILPEILEEESVFSEIIKNKLLMKLTHEARYLLAERIKNENHIFTLRDDDAPEMWIYREGIYIPNGRTYVKEYCEKIAGAGYTKSLSNEVTAHIEASTFIDVPDFFAVQNVDKICVKNGILDLRTRKLEPFSPEYRFFSKINAEYQETPQKNEQLHKFLSEVVSKDDESILQELFGYCLYKKYFIHKAVLFNGVGSNGKGTLLELLKIFLGAENCVNLSLQTLTEDKFAAGNLFCKSACLGGDLSSDALKHSGVFKEVTGNDLITCDRKFKARINFANYAKLIFSANQVPRTADKSEGFFRRWIIIDFPNRFYTKEEIDKIPVEERETYKIANKELLPKITTHEGMNYILSWSLDGLDRLFRNGGFSNSKTTKEIETEYMMRSDSFSIFAKENIEENNEGFTLKSELRSKYIDFCKNKKVPIISDVFISKVLTEQYFAFSKRKENCYYWGGISLKTQTEDIKNEENEEIITEKEEQKTDDTANENEGNRQKKPVNAPLATLATLATHFNLIYQNEENRIGIKTIARVATIDKTATADTTNEKKEEKTILADTFSVRNLRKSIIENIRTYEVAGMTDMKLVLNEVVSSCGVTKEQVEEQADALLAEGIIAKVDEGHWRIV